MARTKKTKDADVSEAVEVVDAEVAQVTEDEAVTLEEPVVEGDEPADVEAPQAIEVENAPAPLQRKGGFFPMVLGGAVAAGIGFGAALYLFPNGISPDAEAFREKTQADMATQANQLAALKAEIAAGGGLSALVSGLDSVKAAQDKMGGTVQAIAEQTKTLEARLSNVEKAPVEAGASSAAVSAYEKELKALQDAMAAQRAEIEKARDAAEAKQASAEITAHEAMMRAAISRIQTALDTGTGFETALADLEAGNQPVPDDLKRVADTGVKSVAMLQASFPEAARAALDAARTASAGQGEQSGFVAFLKTQLGARSLEPREGSDPDAVLSRAEAALREGRLTDTMAEVDALPEVARSEMTSWLEAATQRQNALAALDALSTSMNSN